MRGQIEECISYQNSLITEKELRISIEQVCQLDTRNV